MAGDDGSFTNSEFVVQEEHLGVTFTLTATGQTSGQVATHVFTDSPRVGSVSVSSQSPNPVVRGNSATYTVTVNRGSDPGSSGNFSANLSVTSALPAGATATFSPTTVNLPNRTDSATSQLTITTTTGTPTGVTGFTVQAVSTNVSTDSASGTGTLSVSNPPNRPPTLQDPANVNATEGTLSSVTLVGADPDNDPIAYSLVSGPGAVSGNTWSWTPGENDGGQTLTVTVKVSDGQAEAQQSFDVTVAETNNAPTLEAIADQTTDEGALLSVPLVGADTDLPAQTLVYSLVSGPGSVSGAAWSWTPGEADGPGDFDVTVKVSDGVAETSRSFRVHVDEVNSPPTLEDPADVNVDEGSEAMVPLVGADTDIPTQTLAYSLVSGPGTVSGNTWSWTPGESDGGQTFTVTVKVSDGVAETSQSFDVTVNETNTPPTLEDPADVTVDEGSGVSVVLMGADTDVPAQTLEYSLVSGPGSVTGDTWSWTPGEADGPGDFTVTVKVSDGQAEAQQSFRVHVDEVNVAPTLDPIGDKVVDEETELTFTAVGKDTDIPANTLAYALIGAPDGASIDPMTGDFTWTPSETQGGAEYTFTVRVIDDGSPSKFAEETIKVTVAEVNKAPTLDPIGNQTVDEEKQLTFTAVGRDTDEPADTLTYSLVGEPSGASINPTTGDFTWTPSEAQGGAEYTFTVRVTDDGSPSKFAEETIKVTVAEVNKPPVARDDTADTDEDTPVSVVVTGNDTDDDLPAQTLSVAMATAPKGTVSFSGGTVSFDPRGAFDHLAPGESEDVVISVTITDGNGGTATSELTVTVAGRNDAPTASGDPATQSRQYSDAVATITITADDVDTDLADLSLRVVKSGSATPIPLSDLLANLTVDDGTPGTWVISGTVKAGAGTYTIQVWDGALAAAAAQVVVTRENASIAYNGDQDVTTAGPSVTTAAVRLSARLTEETESPVNSGDITLAVVRFSIYKNGNLGATPDFTVDAVADGSGVAATTVNLPVDTYTVIAKVSPDNVYWSSPCDTATINVSLGSTDRRTTGGGWIPEALSANGKANFGFTVQYQKTGSTTPKGQSVFVIRGSDGYDYVVKSNSWSGGSLGFSGSPTSIATFTGKCVIQAVNQLTGLVDPSRTQGNCTFTVTVRDGDLHTPKITDEYGIRVVTGSGQVWYSTANTRKALGGGNVMVKAK